MESNSAKKLKKENLENTIENLKKDIKELERDYNDAGDGDDKNKFQSKLERKYEELNKRENELNQLNDEINISKLNQLIDILNFYFDKDNDKILKAYNLSLSNKLLINQDKIPQNTEELINFLEYPKPDTETYTYREKFIGYLLLLEQQVCLGTKEKLKKWAENNIKNCQVLCQKLSQELDRIKQEFCPGIFLAIIQEEGSYIFKAWFNKNINQNQQESPSNWRQLTINEKYEIPTDKNLSNIPQILRYWINNTGIDIDIKQIQIFLPYELMNHPVDSWKTEDDDDETIGEFYQVIIRCSERMTGSNPRINRWKTKGKKIKYTTQPTAIFKSYDDENYKIIENCCKQDDVVAVKITKVFQKEQPGTILWKSAIPLGLWIRTKLYDDTTNKAILDELIDDCDLVQDIPEKIKNKRLTSNDIGRHLCLLWDDPNLLPPIQNLTSNKL